MGICKHCSGKTEEGNVHAACAELKARGYSDSEIGRVARGESLASVSAPKPVTFATIVGGVFVGMWLFAITASILFGIIRLINEVATPIPPQ
jgi:hypothetical protein